MKLAKFARDTEGAIASVTALILAVAVGAMSIAIDLGHIFLVRCELQRAADAGAMAGARGLVTLPAGQTGVTITPDCANALVVSKRVVEANTADGGSLSLPDADVIFGAWDTAGKTFQAIGCGNPSLVTAVRVITRKNVPLSFSGILPGGMSSKDVTAEAIGFTGPPGGGTGTFPLAVDADKLPPNNTPFRIHLSPTPGDDGCWHTYKDSSSGASELRDYVNGTKTGPDLNVGDQINVKEGVADSVLKDVADQLASRTDQGQTYDVLVPVVPAGSSHAGWAPIEAFATLRITAVVSQGGDKYLEGYIVPNYTAGLGPGGTTPTGTWTIPKMVL